MQRETATGRTGPLHTDPQGTDPLDTDPLDTDPLGTGPQGADPQRTVPLRNGNPRGNPNLNLAPRCGAKTRRPRSGPCRAPAMPNGRCRMHGGLATGPRTEEGRARIRAANTTHGYYTAERKAARRRVSAAKVEARALLALQRASARAAKSHALLVLHRAGAHPVDVIAPHRLRLPDAAAPRQKVRRSGKTPAT
jgi:hypothetical protein